MILEVIVATSIDELEKKMKEQETYWIREMNSVEDGFNGNYGGKGMFGLALSSEHKEKIAQALRNSVNVEFDDGSVKTFSS